MTKLTLNNVCRQPRWDYLDGTTVVVTCLATKTQDTTDSEHMIQMSLQEHLVRDLYRLKLDRNKTMVLKKHW